MPCAVSSLKAASEAAISAVNAIDYYHHVKDDRLRRFLEINTLDTVFDLEDDPATFKHGYMLNGEGIYWRQDRNPVAEGIVILIEYDERMEERVRKSVDSVLRYGILEYG